MTRGDKTNLWFIVEAVQQVIQLYARQTKYHPHAFAAQRLGERLTTGHFRHIFSSLSRSNGTAGVRHRRTRSVTSFPARSIPCPPRGVNPRHARPWFPAMAAP